MRYSAQSLLAILSTITLAVPSVQAQQGAVEFNQLFGRAAQCAGQLCGWASTLCCASNACYTDVNNQASCKTYLTPVTEAPAGGYWTVATSTYTTNGPYTVTSTYSTYVGGAVTTGVAICDLQQNQQSCGNICCGSNQYCSTVIGGSGQCAAYTAGSSNLMSSYTSIMYATTDSAGVPLRPTASTLVIVTVAPNTATTTTTTTSRAATTEPFQTPITTGANVTLTQAQSSGGSGLSGGAIAGIVIGVLLALFILGLICFYCCLKGIFEGCLAIFGLGRRRERKEVDVYERRTHHGSGSAPAGRTWYGAARPARPEGRRNSEAGKLLGIGAALAALWAILGLKRRNQNRRNEEKQSEYSDYSSYYYTSASSASSDRRTRDDRRSRR